MQIWNWLNQIYENDTNKSSKTLNQTTCQSKPRENYVSCTQLINYFTRHFWMIKSIWGIMKDCTKNQNWQKG